MKRPKSFEDTVWEATGTASFGSADVTCAGAPSVSGFGPGLGTLGESSLAEAVATAASSDGPGTGVGVPG